MGTLQVSFINLFDTTHRSCTSWEEVAKELNEPDPELWYAVQLSSGAAERIGWANRKAFGEAQLVALWNNKARLGNQKASCMCRTTESYVPLTRADQLRALENMRGIVAVVTLQDWEDHKKDPKKTDRPQACAEKS